MQKTILSMNIIMYSMTPIALYNVGKFIRAFIGINLTSFKATDFAVFILREGMINEALTNFLLAVLIMLICFAIKTSIKLNKIK